MNPPHPSEPLDSAIRALHEEMKEIANVLLYVQASVPKVYVLEALRDELRTLETCARAARHAIETRLHRSQEETSDV